MDERIQPVVLGGGRSRRFGRDKLREPIGPGRVLVDQPIAALREVFGPRVALVGLCDVGGAARADAVIPDRYPDAGPIGGILSALEATGTAVVVLAGDLPRIDAATVRAIVTAALAHPAAAAVLAQTDHLQPCIGLYRPSAAAVLADRLGAGGSSRLWDAIPADRLVPVPVYPHAVVNANTVEALANALLRGEGRGTGRE